MKKIIGIVSIVLAVLILAMYFLFSRMEGNITISKSEATQLVMERYDIKHVIEVDIENTFTHSYYEITAIDSQGREVEIEMNAKTGEFIKVDVDYD